MLKQKNSKIQGNIGIGAAISYFTSMGWFLSIPLNDSQKYDLVVDIDGKLNRVQVKTCRYKRKNYEVSLQTNGGNRSGIGKRKPFDNSKVEYLFVLVESGDMWFIPSKYITQKNSMHLTEKYNEHKIT